MSTDHTTEIDETGTFCEHGHHFQNPEPCPDCWRQEPCAYYPSCSRSCEPRCVVTSPGSTGGA